VGREKKRRLTKYLLLGRQTPGIAKVPGGFYQKTTRRKLLEGGKRCVDRYGDLTVNSLISHRLKVPQKGKIAGGHPKEKENCRGEGKKRPF